MQIVPPAAILVSLLLFAVSASASVSTAFHFPQTSSGAPLSFAWRRRQHPSSKAAAANTAARASPTSLTMTAARSAPLTQAAQKARLDSASPIQSGDVATLPRPGSSAPSSVRFHSGGGMVWVTYLLPSDPTSLTRQLYAEDVRTGETLELFQPSGGGGTEDDFTPEEKLRRERLRMMATGVTSYAWSAGEGSGTMLIPFGGALWVLDDPLGGGSGGEPRMVLETNRGEADPDDFHALPTDAPLLDAKISSDGSTLAFVAGDEVYVAPVVPEDSGGQSRPRRVTSGARGKSGITNGVADYLAQEELERADGFWLSPGGTRVAFEEVDESHVPPYRIVHQGEDRGLAPTFEEGKGQAEVEEGAKVTLEETRYPFAGARNPIVKFGVVDATEGGEGGNVTWFDLSRQFGDDFYLAKVEWLPAAVGSSEDSTRLVVQVLDRRQQKLAILLLDCATGDMTTLHVETAIEGAWVNLNDAFRVLSNPNSEKFRFLWASERDGYRHLYVLEASLADGGSANTNGAKVIQRLTGPGEFICEEVLDVDEESGVIYYMGTEPNRWLERHLFRVQLGDLGTNKVTPPECLTGSVSGQHSCVLDLRSGLVFDVVSSTTQAPVASIHELPAIGEAAGTSEIRQLYDAAVDPRLVAYGDALKPPEFHTFPSTDGKVTLQAALYLPDEETYGKGPYPLVVATYGGPHVQYVQDTWGMMTVDMRSQYLRANGFAVIKVDNRGSNRRGIVFEMPVYLNMGELEVADQAAGVAWAINQGIADKERVAVSGWSYGGYMALKCLMDKPDVFHSAISGAPVTDWALYDTAYTERYMGLPQENPDGYAKASALANVAKIQGSLLLCHGLLDENVLFRQSAVLVNALIEHQKVYDLALFPSERHGPRRQQDRAYLEERILAFLQRTLGV